MNYAKKHLLICSILVSFASHAETLHSNIFADTPYASMSADQQLDALRHLPKSLIKKRHYISSLVQDIDTKLLYGTDGKVFKMVGSDCENSWNLGSIANDYQIPVDHYANAECLNYLKVDHVDKSVYQQKKQEEIAYLKQFGKRKVVKVSSFNQNYQFMNQTWKPSEVNDKSIFQGLGVYAINLKTYTSGFGAQMHYYPFNVVFMGGLNNEWIHLKLDNGCQYQVIVGCSSDGFGCNMSNYYQVSARPQKKYSEASLYASTELYSGQPVTNECQLFNNPSN